MPAPDTDELMQWIQGALPEDQAAAIAAQVDADPELEQTVRQLRALADQVEEPPPLVAQRLDQHYQRWLSERERMIDDRLELIAELAIDTRRDGSLVATRGAESSAVFQCVYRCDPADVVVDITPLGNSRVQMSGQVLPTDTAEAPIFEAVVDATTESIRSIDGDRLGRFELPDVPVEALTLTVDNGRLRIVMPLSLGTLTDDR